MANIEKIYKVSVPGADGSVKQMVSLSNAFDKARLAKIALNKELATATSKGDTAAVTQLKNAVAELDKKLKELSTQRTKATREAESQARAEKVLADIKLVEAKAAKEQELADKVRTANLIQQEKELERLIKQEERLSASRQKQTAQAGSQRDRLNALAELRPFIQDTAPGSTATTNFRGEMLSLDQAIAKFKELSFAEQTFRRQFQQDGTLVGEYSKGILNAFSKAGLNDLIKNQGDRIKGELDKLDKEFAELQQQLSQVGVKADGSFEVLEKQLIDNRKAAIGLQDEMEKVNTTMQGAGGIGKQAADAIKNGFRDAKNQIAQLLIGYIGFQKVYEQVSQGVADAKQIEGVEAAFRNLNNPNLLDGLRQATRGTVSDLELMKQAVQAQNFQIPVEQLGTLLDFARRRAKDTGQEVDYLVQSIITGIGRKSPLILDNLGISAVRLKEKFKGLSEEQVDVGQVAQAVSQIIAEENAKAGAEIDTAGEKIAAQQAKWANIRTELGTRLLPVLSAVTSIMMFFVGNLPLVATLLGLYAAGWAMVNRQMIINRTELILQRTLLPVLSVLFGGQANALRAWAVATQFLTAAKTRLLAVLNNPYFRIFSLLLGGIALALQAYASKLTDVITGTDRLAQKQRFLNEINADALKQIAQTRAQEESLLRIIQDRTLADEVRQKALTNLKSLMGEYGEALTLENILTEKGTKALKAFNDELLRRAQVTAATAIAQRENNRLQQLFQYQYDIQNAVKSGGEINTGQFDKEFLDKYYEQQGRSASKLGKFLGDKVGIDFTYSGKDLAGFAKLVEDEINKQLDKTKGAELAKIEVEGPKAGDPKAPTFAIDIEKTKKELDNLNDAVQKFKGSQAEFTKLLADRDAKQREYDALMGKKQKESASKLTAGEKDMFKDIEAARDLAATALAKEREQGLIGEQTYLVRLNDINQEAIRQKLAMLKGSNAEQRKLQGDLQLESITKQNELDKKLFDQNKAALERQRKQAQDAAKEQLEVSEGKAGATETDKAAAKLAYDEAMLAAEVDFSTKMLLLEQNYKKQSALNEQERAAVIRGIRRQLQQDTAALADAELKDSQTRLATDVSAIKKTFESLRLGNAQSTLPASQKEQNAKDLDKAETRSILSYEIESLKKELPIYEGMLAAGLNVAQQFNDKQTELSRKQRELVELTNADLEEKWNSQLSLMDNLKNKFAAFLRDVSGIKKGSAQDSALGQAIGDAVSQAYSLATDAMNGYFDAERARIEESKNLQLERLDFERKQMLSRAQSRAEEDSINRQFDTKKRQAEQEAFNKNKEIKKKEARISFFLELANIWTSVWKIGNPIAAALMGAVFTGLAAVRYNNNIKGIESQKFARGGGIAPTERGGVSKGPSHANGGIPFNYEAEGEELFIVNKRSTADPRRYTVSGTTKQIASKLNELGGGIQFAAGASARKLADGGYLGMNVKAPVFVPSAGNAQNFAVSESMAAVSDLAAAVAAQANAIAEQSQRIDRIQVVQVTDSVTAAQAKKVKQTSIGTL